MTEMRYEISYEHTDEIGNVYEHRIVNLSLEDANDLADRIDATEGYKLTDFGGWIEIEE